MTKHSVSHKSTCCGEAFTSFRGTAIERALLIPPTAPAISEHEGAHRHFPLGPLPSGLTDLPQSYTLKFLRATGEIVADELGHCLCLWTSVDLTKAPQGTLVHSASPQSMSGCHVWLRRGAGLCHRCHEGCHMGKAQPEFQLCTLFDGSPVSCPMRTCLIVWAFH